MTTRRLVFIAGPMAVGKSTLINRLMAGELEEVRRRLGLHAADEWHVLDKSELPVLRAQATTSQVLCHFDILHFMTGPTGGDAVEPFDGAEESRVVTLWAAPATLQARLVARDFHGQHPAPSQRSNWNRWSRHARRLPRWLRDYLGARFLRRGSWLSCLMRRTLGITPVESIFQVLERYRDPASVTALYESWRELCVARGAEQLFIDTTDGSYRFVEQPPWSAAEA
jgi:GTPase SAR1 family protein